MGPMRGATDFGDTTSARRLDDAQQACRSAIAAASSALVDGRSDELHEPAARRVVRAAHVDDRLRQQLLRLRCSLLFSPWFRLIVQKWMKNWWEDLNETMTTNKHCDFVNIQQFDPLVVHTHLY